MPRIPFGIADPQLPASAGLRGGVVQTPVVQEPGLDAEAAMLPGRALTEIGGQVGQAGQYLQQAEAYQFQRQRAQDVLDSTLGFQDFAQQYQPALAERQKGDYRTMATDVVKMGRDLAKQVAQQRQLSPQARALFQEKAETAITRAQQGALEFSTQRFQQDSIFAVSTEVQQVQADAADARDEGELMMTLGRLQGTLMQGVSSGLWGGDVAAKMYRETEFTVRKDRAARQIWNTPHESFQELLRMSQGQRATTGAFQHLPTPLIEPLLREAATRIGHVAQLQEVQRRAVKAQQQDLQNRNAIQLTADLHSVKPLPENVALLEQHVERIRLAGPAGHLEKDEYQQLLNHATAWAEKARAFVPRDDEAKKKALQVVLTSLQTPEDYRWFKDQVAANGDGLTGDTYQKLMQDADTYANRNHPLNIEEYKEARRRILDWAGINPSSPAPVIAGILRTADQENTANALLALQSWAVTQPPDVLKRDALGMADSLMDTYLKQMSATQVMSAKGISPVLQTGGPLGQVAPNEEWAMYALNHVRGMTDAQRGRELKQFETFRLSAAGKLALENLYGKDLGAVPSPWAIGPYVPPGLMTPQPPSGGTKPSAQSPPPSSAVSPQEPKAFSPVRK